MSNDKDFWAIALMAAGFILLGYNVGSMAKIASLSNGQVLADLQVRGGQR